MFMELTLLTYLGIMGLVPLNDKPVHTIEISSAMQINTVTLWIGGNNVEEDNGETLVPVCLLFGEESQPMAEITPEEN
jgi:hypothetical protein